MRLRGKYNIGALFLICFTVSLLLPVSVASSKYGQNQSLRLNKIVSLALKCRHGFIGGHIDPAFLKKSGKAAHHGFKKVFCEQRTIPEKEWSANMAPLNDAATFAVYDPGLHSGRPWLIRGRSTCPQGSLLVFSRRSPPSA